jgi:hypothetical protein
MDGSRAVLMKFQAYTLEIENDVGHVFLDPGDRGKLMQHPVKFDGNNGCPLNGRQKYSSESVPQCGAEAAFQRLAGELPISAGVGRLINIDSLWLNQTTPVSLHNSFPCPSDVWLLFYLE